MELAFGTHAALLVFLNFSHDLQRGAKHQQYLINTTDNVHLCSYAKEAKKTVLHLGTTEDDMCNFC